MELYLIRHAQSANNLLHAKTNSDRDRVEDPELTELGRKQAEVLAAYLAREFTFTHLYTSLMIRAVATADAIAQRMQLRPTAWPEVHERLGIFLENEETGTLEGQAGKTRSYFKSRFPDLVLPDSLNEHGWWNRPAETQDQWAQRARTFWTELSQRHSDENDCVAVVFHGGFYREILCTLFGIPSDSALWFRLYNTAISGIDFTEGLVNVSYLNRIDHLPPDLVS